MACDYTYVCGMIMTEATGKPLRTQHSRSIHRTTIAALGNLIGAALIRAGAAQLLGGKAMTQEERERMIQDIILILREISRKGKERIRKPV